MHVRASDTPDPVDAAPPIISVHPANLARQNGDAANLSVTATVADGGVLSYQWFSTTENNNTGGTRINGATDRTYSAPTSALGIRYYYVAVTNTNNSADGIKTATLNSNAASVTVTAANSAKVPTITKHPEGVITKVDDTVTLSAAATVTDGGTITYQWFRNIIEANEGGEPINGATSANYSVPTETVGTFFYYVVITNTNNAALVTKVQTATSDVATVKVNPIVHAQTPSIVAQLASRTVFAGDVVNLAIGVIVQDGGTLSYQWFSNSTNSNEGGAAINNATSSVYTAPSGTIGVYYYYVVITNTNNAVNGDKTATVTSKSATVTVNAVNAAQIPIIVSQPQGAEVETGAELILTVDAYVTDGGELSFQWYSNNSSTNSGGTIIANATEARYTVPTSDALARYYYVVVTNTNESMTTKTASINSNAVAVSITNPIKIVTPPPPQPSVDKITANSITIKMLPPDATTGQIIEYAISTTNNPEEITEWQTDLVFSNLFSNTVYYIFARAQATEEFDASAVSVYTTVLTKLFYTQIEDIYFVIAGASVVVLAGFILLGASKRGRKKRDAAENKDVRSAIMSAATAATIYNKITPPPPPQPAYYPPTNYYEHPPMPAPRYAPQPPPPPYVPRPSAPARPAVVYLEPPSVPPVKDGTYKNTALLVRGVVSITKKTLSSGTVIYDVEFVDGRKSKGGEDLVKDFLHLLTL